MYKITKNAGTNQTITLEVVETATFINLGKLTTDIKKILETEVEFDETKEHAVKLKDKWNFTVSDDVGKALSATTMPIRKPIRKHKKATTEQDDKTTKTIKTPKTTKTGRAVVDVFDLIFGTE